jgi:K+-sensing histidine kinase KdpD
LPQLSRRLQATLDELRSPQVETREMVRPARAWWADIERRHGDGSLQLEARIDGEASVPVNLFDAFLENCIDNARGKGGDGVRMKATLAVGERGAELAFEDSGEPVPAALARALFREPIASAGSDGFGIGLYQVGRLAAQSGYTAELAGNEPGSVVFRLRPA